MPKKGCSCVDVTQSILEHFESQEVNFSIHLIPPVGLVPPSVAAGNNSTPCFLGVVSFCFVLG